MDDPDFLTTPDGRRLAYSRTAPAPGTAARGVVFLGGLSSDMTGTKALFLEDWARGTGRAFLRFDYTGHGRSSGRFEDGTVGEWAQDAVDAIRALTDGPQILVGSSLGGWIALLLAHRRDVPVAGIVGIAAAPDFTEDFLLHDATPQQRAALLTRGATELESDYEEPTTMTARLLADGTNHLLLDRQLLIDAPLRLLHGTADTDVPVRTALRILDALGDGADARLILVKDADHRLSGAAELALLRSVLEELVAATAP